MTRFVRVRIFGRALGLAIVAISTGCLDPVAVKGKAPGVTPSVGDSPSVTTPKGWVVTFNHPVVQGVDYVASSVSPFPIMIAARSGLSITSITHPNIPSSERISVFMPDTPGAQPYDPLDNNYDSQPRVSYPLSIAPPLAAPRMIQLARLDPERAAASRAGAHVWPVFDPSFGDTIAILPEIPSADRLFPPMIGTAALRNRVFTKSEVQSRVSSLLWDPSLVTTANPVTHTAALAQVTDWACRGEHFMTPFSNVSFGQIYVQGPLGEATPWAFCPQNWWQASTGVCEDRSTTPATPHPEYRPLNDPYDEGTFASTYGGVRHQKILEIVMWMMDPAATPAAREALTLCAVQNIFLGYVGATLMGLAINEPGGQSGGFMIGAYLASFLLPSHTSVRSDLDLRKAEPTQGSNPNRAGFGESALLFRGPDNVWYYGSTAFGSTYKQANCQLIGDWHYCNGPYGVVGPQSTAVNLQVFDARGDGGYWSTVWELFTTTSGIMQINPTLKNYVDYQPVHDFVSRMFLVGPKTYDPSLEGALRAHLTAAGGSVAQVNAVINYLVSTNFNRAPGNYGVQWLKTWYQNYLLTHAP